MKNILLTFATLTFLTACAQGVDAVERLGTCVIDGNQDGNCEISTLEDNQESTSSTQK